MTRPHISVKDKVTVAIAQAAGGHIYCPLCGKPLLPTEPRILEHMIVRAFTGSDEVKYLAWVHKACADLKTYGRKSTCADGDIHKIAKAKRLARKHLGQVEKPKRQIPGRKGIAAGKSAWPGSRKIQSRGFEKRREERT